MSDKIATLHRFVPVIREQEEATHCMVAQVAAQRATFLLSMLRPDYRLKLFKNFSTENIVDCAVALPDNPKLISKSVLDIGQVNGTAEAKPGDIVMKSGRTSGLTKGKVTAVGATLRVGMGNDAEAWFADQVVTDMESKPGDSGSLVLNENKQAVGLLFAGSDQYTIFNKIQNVTQALSIEF